MTEKLGKKTHRVEFDHEVYRHERQAEATCYVCDGAKAVKVVGSALSSGGPTERTCWRCNGTGLVDGGTRSVLDHVERVTCDVTLNVERMVWGAARRAPRNKNGRAVQQGGDIAARVIKRERKEGGKP